MWNFGWDIIMDELLADYQQVIKDSKHIPSGKRAVCAT